MRKTLIAAVALLACSTACNGSSDDSTSADHSTTSASPTEAGPPPCNTIKIGAPVTAAFLESGCLEATGSIYVLNHTKCRGDGQDFGTFDIKDSSTGAKLDQAFAYKGTWHSTNKETTLYSAAFQQCT